MKTLVSDPLLLSGLLMFALALWATWDLQRPFRETVERLAERGSFQSRVQEITREICRPQGRLILLFSSMFAIAIFVAFLFAFTPERALVRPLTYFETFLGAVAGGAVARMVCYGRLGSVLRRLNLPVNLDPSHPDGAAGVKPVGSFFFLQAIVAAAPAIFLAAWQIPFMTLHMYPHWRGPYLGLLPIAILIEVLAFALPMRAFHELMLIRRQDLRAEADRLGNEITALRSKLASGVPADERKDLESSLEWKLQRFTSIERMPTWPVARQTRRAFAINNLLLLIPPVLDLVSGAAGWRDLIASLARVL